MDGTGIRPGVLKATSGYEIADRRRQQHALVAHWFEALARTHHETGLPITTHLGGDIAVAQLNALTKHGVAPSAISLGHADGQGTLDQLLMAVDRGAYLSFNCGGKLLDSSSGVRTSMTLVKALIDRGYLSQITLSVDAGFLPYQSLRLDKDGSKRTYRCVFTRMVPALEKLGITRSQIHQILVANPRRHLGAREA